MKHTALTKSHLSISPLYSMGHLSRYKSDVKPSAGVIPTRYKVYVGNAVVKSTNDIKVARNAVHYYKGILREF